MFSEARLRMSVWPYRARNVDITANAQHLYQELASESTRRNAESMQMPLRAAEATAGETQHSS